MNIKNQIFYYKDKYEYVKGTIVTDTIDNAIKYIKKEFVRKKEIFPITIKNKDLNIKKEIYI